MNRLKILVDAPEYKPGLQALRQLAEVELVPFAEKPRELPAALLHDKQILFCALPPTNFHELKSLGWIQITSAGYAQLIGLDLPGQRIRATNALGVFDVPIAEWNIAMMINLRRDLRAMIRHQEAAVWDRNKRFQDEIRGRVVGLWGYGGIGRETARLAKALGLTVHVLVRHDVSERRNTYCVPGTGDPAGQLPDRVFRLAQKDEFLRGLDYLILAIPLTSQNEGIVGAAELQTLAPHAYILNPARGPLIQEAALLRALRERWIAGAALDTHYRYPLPPEHPLWQMPNVILTPHISGSSSSPHFAERIWDIFVQNVERFRNNQPLINELTTAQLRG